jgi:hypothetical protein
MTQNTEQRYKTVTFTVVDPRTMDGNPYEVAERAIKQMAGVASVLKAMVDATEKMARNAEMERAFANRQEPQGSEWPNTPQGKAWARLDTDVTIIIQALNTLGTAAAYDPKRPPKE